MKYMLVIFTLLSDGKFAVLDDVDGPRWFPNARACLGHGIKVRQPMQRLFRDFYPKESKAIVRYRCIIP